LGVAVLGSVLAGAYSATLGRAVDVAPADVRTQVRQSIVGTLEAIRGVQAGGDPEAARAAAELVQPAREAFVAGLAPGRRRCSQSDPNVPRTVDDGPVRRSP
jgi:hypothetical protein